MNTPSFPTDDDAVRTNASTNRRRASATPPDGEPRRSGSALALAVFAGASALVAAAGARVTIRNKGWYRLLRKSSLTPPDRVFSTVWPALYTLGALSAARVARAERSPARARALALWGAQLACNGGWSPLFFGLHRPRGAMAALALNAASLAAYAAEARKIDPVAAAMVLPNLGWLAFAGILNAAAIRRNTGLFRLLLKE